jgi:predicted dehydrogenase
VTNTSLVTALSPILARRVLGSNDAIHVAVVGIRGKGGQHIEEFHKLDGVRVTALCDVDQDILEREVQKFKDRSEPVDRYTDVRKVLYDKNIDAVVIATPNHWHSLIAIWACQAGKDVYVEKPVSHNIWEGKRLVNVARKYRRIVQAGTQNRSDTGFRDAVEYIQQGHLGKILWAHGLWYKKRDSIGLVNGPQKIPKSVDYDLWTGPAKLEPLMRQNLHYDWHWDWSTGNGDMGNLGAHQIDDCRFALKKNELPQSVVCVGGRFGYTDDGETPNTILAVYNYPTAPFILEIRNLPHAQDANWMDHYRGIRMGNVIQCEEGYFAGGRGGGWVYDNDGKKIKQFPGDGGAGHQLNFIHAVRQRDKSLLHADIKEGHLSAALCHMGNISYLSGLVASPDEIKSKLEDNTPALDTFERLEEHLKANGVNIQTTPMTLGEQLKLDLETETFETPDANSKIIADSLYKDAYREPFVVPDIM